jgi:tetratricopeptide (TPR) repeat protein
MKMSARVRHASRQQQRPVSRAALPRNPACRKACTKPGRAAPAGQSRAGHVPRSAGQAWLDAVHAAARLRLLPRTAHALRAAGGTMRPVGTAWLRHCSVGLAVASLTGCSLIPASATLGVGQVPAPQPVLRIQGGAVLTAQQAYAMGKAALQASELQRALLSFEKALSLSPDWADAENGRMVALARLGRTDEAILSGQRAVAFGAHSAELHGNLGLLLDGRGDSQRAAIHLARAAQLDPDNPAWLRWNGGQTATATLPAAAAPAAQPQPPSVSAAPASPKVPAALATGETSPAASVARTEPAATAAPTPVSVAAASDGPPSSTATNQAPAPAAESATPRELERAAPPIATTSRLAQQSPGAGTPAGLELVEERSADASSLRWIQQAPNVLVLTTSAALAGKSEPMVVAAAAPQRAELAQPEMPAAPEPAMPREAATATATATATPAATAAPVAAPAAAAASPSTEAPAQLAVVKPATERTAMTRLPNLSPMVLPRVEVSNGHGQRGLARATASILQDVLAGPARLTNHAHYRVQQTQVMYRTADELPAAQALARALGIAQSLVLPNGQLRASSPVRLLIGQDLPSATLLQQTVAKAREAQG